MQGYAIENSTQLATLNNMTGPTAGFALKLPTDIYSGDSMIRVDSMDVAPSTKII